MSQYEVTFAGFGGQGVMVAGQLLSYTGIKQDKNVVWIPSYGPEMRGGTAYCTVVISDVRIGSPIISNPQGACVFNRPSFDKFSTKVKPGGLLLVNSSLIPATTDRTDITELLVPANAIAMEAGSVKAVNVVMLGAFVGATDVVDIKLVKAVLTEKLGHKKSMLDINLKVLDQSYKLAKQQLAQGQKV
ncbi:MAG: 2-oxoacid:acceptor oxidoreductase family protein [candidate division Zixibacteria bacterium]|nr:2-oxoacid:acceptor oxidoreductase family protein [candidate division Zixibacteria bacterium]